MRLRIALLFLTALLAARAMAQEVRTIDGEKFIVHQVKQGETLFGLSRHYAVPLDVLTGANPAAAEGLSIGQVILVPVKAQSRRELKNAPELGEGGLLHTVARKETIYGIAKKYGVTQEDLRRWNPDLQYGLVVGMVLRVETASSIAAPPLAVQPAEADSDLFHLVAPGETLYSLGQQFGLSTDEIKEANGGLPEGLKAGTYVRIPRGGSGGAQEEPAGKDGTAAPLSPEVRHRIAILLPFTQATDQESPANEEDPRQNPATEAAVEFRAGVDIALDTLRAQGLNADVYVFDSGMKPTQWNDLFKSDQVRGMDLYIGPFHRAAIEGLVKVAGGSPIICPVPQSNKVILGNPTVSKALGGRTDRLKLMARYVAYNHARDNVILLKPDIFSERDLQDLVARELDQALAKQSGRFSDSLRWVACGRRDVSKTVAMLIPGRTNVLVVPSEDVEFVTTVLGKMAPLADKYPIKVFGLHAWTRMNTLDVQALVKLQVHVPANAFLDLASPRVNDFIAAYRARFRNEPGEYAFLGYDVALYFMRAEMLYGKTFPQHYGEVAARPVYLDFSMVQLGPGNGWNNAHAVMLEYRSEGLLRAR